MRKVNRFILIILASLTFFNSCSILTQEENTPTVKNAFILIKGSINEGEPNSSARTAIPTNPTTNVTYTVTASQVGKNIVSGNLNANNTAFEIALPSGGVWEISVKKFLNDNLIMQEIWTTTDLPDIAVTINHSFVLRPLTAGTGRIQLSLTVDTSVKSIAAIGIKSSGSIYVGPIDTTTTLFVDNIESGNYDVELRFYNHDTEQTPETLIYCCEQSINVFDGLTTDKWIKNGDDECITDTGVFNLTSQIIENFEPTDFYVDSSLQSTNPEAANYTTESGTYLNPSTKISSAFKMINSKKRTDTFNIFIKDGTEETLSSGLTLNKKVSLRCYKNNYTDNLGKATLYRGAGNTASLITINSGAEFTMDGLVLDGNYDAQNSSGPQFNTNGGAVNNSGKFTMNSGVVKNHCFKSSANGIIYNSGNFTMNGGEIHTNSSNQAAVYNINSFTLNNGKIHDNNSKNSGAGIYTQTTGNIVNINGGEIYSNTCTDSGSTGGGLMIASGAESSITDGKIYSNTSNTNGGGVFISSNCTLNFTGGEIYDNTCGITSNGSGIYDNGTLKMSGSACVKEGNDVYLNGETKFEFSGPMDSDYSLDNPCAFITPKEYISTSVYFKTTNLSSNFNKIAIIDKNGSWGIDKTTGKISPTLYVDATKETDGDGSRKSPCKTLAKASNICETYKYTPITINVTGTTLETEGAVFGTSTYTPTITISGSDGSCIKNSTVSGQSLITINEGTTLTLKYIDIDGNFVNNRADGAGIHNEGSLSLDNVTIKNCKDANLGGGLYTTGTLSLTNTTFESNESQKGGGIYSTNSLSLNNTITFISNNSFYGGGIYSSSELTLDGVNFSSNSSTNGRSIYGAGTLIIKDETGIDEEQYIYHGLTQPLKINSSFSKSIYLKLSNYSTGRFIISTESLSKKDLVKIIPDVNTKAYYIGDDGKLASTSFNTIISSISSNPNTSLANISSITGDGISISSGTKTVSGDTNGTTINVGAQKKILNITGGTVTFENIDFKYNGSSSTRDADGNFITISGSSTNVTFKNCKFIDMNNGTHGSVASPMLIGEGSTVTFENCEITGGYKLANSSLGGAITVKGTAIFKNSSVKNFMCCHSGGAVYVTETGNCSFTGGSIESNSGTEGAGLFVAEGGIFSADGTNICNNKANGGKNEYNPRTAKGGAGFIRGTATFTNCTITENTANNAGSRFYIGPAGKVTVNGGTLQSYSDKVETGGSITIN